MKSAKLLTLALPLYVTVDQTTSQTFAPNARCMSALYHPNYVGFSNPLPCIGTGACPTAILRLFVPSHMEGHFHTSNSASYLSTGLYAAPGWPLDSHASNSNISPLRACSVMSISLQRGRHDST